MSERDQQTKVLKKIRAISFDLDDTLWDCEPVIVHAENQLNKWMKEHHPAVLARHTTDSIKALRSGMYTTHKHLSADVTAMRKAFISELLGDAIESSAKEKIVNQAFDVFYQARSEVTLYEGTHELLIALGKSYKLAAITNGNADLEIIGLADFFQDIRRADLENPRKPEIDMFNACCKTLNIAADELLHVGDNPHTDVQGGHNAGAWTVWFNQTNELWPSDLQRATFEVHSLQELRELLVSVSAV